MLYRIGTKKEIVSIQSTMPAGVWAELYRCTEVLDAEYGASRDYLLSGGYSLIADTSDSVAEIREIIDYDSHPCEWADRHGDWLSALYLLNDDFSLVVFLPIAIAPDAIKNELED